MLWFEQLNSRLNLRFLAGSIILGGLPFFFLSIPYALYVPASRLAWFSQVLVVMVVITYLMFAARYARTHIEALSGYVSTVTAEKQSWNLSRLYSVLPALGVYLLISLGLLPVFYDPTLSGFLGNLPYFYFNFVNATFIWVVLYSAYSVYKMGNLPLSLRSFAEDRFLGLRPFGDATLILTGMYEVYVVLFLGLVLLAVGTIAALGLLVAFFLTGLVVFILPLVSVRRKLVEAKRHNLNWVGPRYARLVRVLEETSNERLDTSLHDELDMIDKLQRDIKEIHTWPFDLGVFARLSAVVLTVVAIILGRILQLALHLAT